MELVFVGPPAFLDCLAIVLPDSTRDERPVEQLERDDTAFICPMDPIGLHHNPIYDSKLMFRGSQVNMLKTVTSLGMRNSENEAYLPRGTALGVSVWGSAWLIGTANGPVKHRDKASVALDSFFAAYVVARGIPGIKRLVCPPLNVRSGVVGLRAGAAQIAMAYKRVCQDTEALAIQTNDSRGVPCYLAMYKEEDTKSRIPNPV